MTALAGFKGTSYSHAHDGSTDALRWVWDALEEVVLALPVASLIVEEAEPNRERMLKLTRENYSTATDLADALVRVAGLSFRDAHHVVGRVVRLAMDDGRRGDEIDREMILQAAHDVLGHTVELDETVVRKAVDPLRAVESRQNTGGPSRHDIEHMLTAMKIRLRSDRKELSGRHERVDAATRRLDGEVSTHLESSSVA